jgi:5,10-methylenetetrahydromethanopterin reductase
VTKIGIKIDGRKSEDLIGLAKLAERSGFDELWVCEDFGLAGGIAQVGAALASTERLEVGLGIAPAAVRNPMYLAMEFASLTRMFPGRFHPGIGHGMPRWLDQVGQRPVSLMACLAEVTESVQALLAGETVNRSGRHVNLRDVALIHPPESSPRLSLGVRGPKGIDLCAQLNAGPILAEGSTPDYIADVRRVVGPDSHITVFVWEHLVPENAALAYEEMTPTARGALTDADLAAQLGVLFNTKDEARGLTQLTVSGDVPACAAAIERLALSGADSVVLQPIRGREEEQIKILGQLLLPVLKGHDLHAHT